MATILKLMNFTVPFAKPWHDLEPHLDRPCRPRWTQLRDLESPAAVKRSHHPAIPAADGMASFLNVNDNLWAVLNLSAEASPFSFSEQEEGTVSCPSGLSHSFAFPVYSLADKEPRDPGGPMMGTGCLRYFVQYCLSILLGLRTPICTVRNQGRKCMGMLHFVLLFFRVVRLASLVRVHVPHVPGGIPAARQGLPQRPQRLGLP